MGLEATLKDAVHRPPDGDAARAPAHVVTLPAAELAEGNLGSLAYVRHQKRWARAGSAPTADRLEIEAQNLTRIVVNVRRARLSCRPRLDVETDGPLTVRLAGCGRAIRFDAGD